MFDAEPREVRQHLACKVPRRGCDAPLGTQGDWKVIADEMIGQLLHFGRIGAARVQHGAAAPVDGARFSRFSGIMWWDLLVGSSRFRCVRASQPRRRPTTSTSFSLPR